MNNSMIIKLVMGFLGFVLLLNMFHIVPSGKTAVSTEFGKVQPKHYPEGFYLVAPWASFEDLDTRNLRYEIEGLNIPTQDRFNSTANVTVLYRIEGSKVPWIKTNYGTQEEFIDKTMRQFIRTIIRDEGRKVKDSRGLAQSDIVTNMQVSATQRLTESMEGTGVTVQEVLIQDIKFDDRITKQILDTQERIQREEAENSQLRIDVTKASQKKAQAKGDADQRIELAKAAAFEVESKAKSNATAARQSADAARYSLEQQALGNRALQASLTPEILKLRELEVRQVEAGSGWNGSVPTTVTLMGNDKPLFLKQMQ